MPGTPCDCIAVCTCASRSAGCAAKLALATTSMAAIASAVGTRRRSITAFPFIGGLESGLRCSQRLRPARAQAPEADGQQWHHVDDEEQPRQRAIAARDQ